MASSTAEAAGAPAAKDGIRNGNGASKPAAAAAAAAPAASPDSVQEQIRQLNEARKLVLGNVSIYPTIVQGILPILTPASLAPLRRWGADFLAEAFAAPLLPLREKESLSLLVLESLKGMLQNAHEDAFVLRSVIQAAASIYPLVLRWIIHNSYDAETWERISTIKSRILRLWESPVVSVQVCCIKFAQRVVLAQTHAAHPELLKRDGLDINLSMIPPNHTLLDPRRLEAEATGLLDRMLGALQDSNSDALIVDATLNTLSILVRTRPSTVQRTLHAVLSFNPLKLAEGNLTPRTRVLVRSMEKTTRVLLIHILKRDPSNPFNSRIQQHLERLARAQAELLGDSSRKRAWGGQPAAAGEAKRQRMGGAGAGTMASTTASTAAAAAATAAAATAVAAQQMEIPALGPGPKSLADIFALTANGHLRAFNASNVPLDLAAKISVSTLARVDGQLFARALAGVRERLAALDAAATQLPLNPDTAPLDVEDDDDDYEPDFSVAEDAEQILNKLDNEASAPAPASTTSPATTEVARVAGVAADGPSSSSSLALGSFHLPAAPPLTPEQAVQVGQTTVSRIFDMVHQVDGDGTTALAAAGGQKSNKAGLNRVAASAFDADAWITILARLATRPTSGLEAMEEKGGDNDEEGDGDEGEDAKTGIVAKAGTTTTTTSNVLGDKIRELLFRYVLEDFRKRIDVAVAWLCEEWYNEQLAPASGHYDAWVVRVLDGFLPYLHAQDTKVLTRFLGEVPALNRGLLQRVKSLCRDPSMVPVALTSLLYQLMMRPPARDLTLDTMEEIWVEFEDARPMATKYLDKWRPGFVQAQKEAKPEAAA